jgi:hypothetical protein
MPSKATQLKHKSYIEKLAFDKRIAVVYLINCTQFPEEGSHATQDVLIVRSNHYVGYIPGVRERFQQQVLPVVKGVGGHRDPVFISSSQYRRDWLRFTPVLST